MKLFNKRIKKIILHTAAFRGPADVDTIRRWHKEKGWDDIGYHYVITGSIYDDVEEIQNGRDDIYQGAHAYGYNSNSIGVCVTGNGDHMEWSDKQMELVKELVRTLMATYDIPITSVIGHRETFTNKFNLRKTCPGKLIDMDEVRKYIIS